MTEVEAEQFARARFREAVGAGDQDGDSRLTLLEFERATLVYDEKHGPPREPEERKAPPAADLFRMFDKNSDGRLFLAEVPPAHRVHIQGMFSRLGRDASESLSVTEFERMSTRGEEDGSPQGAQASDETARLGPHDDDRVPPKPADVFRMFDRDRDGKLVADEMPEPHRFHLIQMLSRLGRGPDGYVTEEEFEAVMSQAREPERHAPGRTASRGRGQADSGQPDSRGEPETPAVSDSDRSGGTQAPETRFRIVDRNRDGFVDRVEAQAAPRELRPWIEQAFVRSRKGLLTIADVAGDVQWDQGHEGGESSAEGPR